MPAHRTWVMNSTRVCLFIYYVIFSYKQQVKNTENREYKNKIKYSHECMNTRKKQK